MTKVISAQLPDDLAKKFHTRLNENHKTQTKFLIQIVKAYFDFEADGYLNRDGDKLDTLQTELVLKEKLRAVQAGILWDKVAAEKELNRVKEEERKNKARDRALRRQPLVDWGSSLGTADERSNLE